MKKVLYSALAVTCAIAGVAATKAKANVNHRATFFYQYIGAYPVNSAALITNVAKWTLVTVLPSCPAFTQACSVETTIPATTVLGIHPSAKLTSIQTVTGANPRFTASKAAGTRTSAVHSKVNQ